MCPKPSLTIQMLKKPVLDKWLQTNHQLEHIICFLSREIVIFLSHEVRAPGTAIRHFQSHHTLTQQSQQSILTVTTFIIVLLCVQGPSLSAQSPPRLSNYCPLRVKKNKIQREIISCVLGIREVFWFFTFKFQFKNIFLIYGLYG